MMTVAKGVVVVALVLGAARAHAQTAQCVVTEIVASSDKKGLDPRLERLKAKLVRPPFSAWDTFVLVGEQSVSAERLKPATAPLTQGTLTLLYKDKMAAQGGRARLRFGVDLDNKQGRRSVSTVVAFDAGDPLLIAGEPVKGGTYILALGCTAP
jgi:hypothetical protein